jgi:hypothetical protein
VVGVGVLGLLIILGLIFQAPWKVMVLLVVFLLAHTVLPKPGLKWFWAGVGVVVLALVIWVFLPEDDTGWRPYTFDEELAALEAKRAIPDEENAAMIYNQLLDAYDSNSFHAGLEESEIEKIPMRKPWLSEEHPKIAEWVERHQATISTLLNAAKVEKCRFPINADLISFDYTMDRTSPMRNWAYLLRSAANNDIAEGRRGKGLEKLVAVLQIGNHQRQQASLIEFLVGVALEALAISEFKSFVVNGDAADEHLIVIEKALEAVKYDWSTDFPRFIEHEKLMHKNLWGMFYGVNSQGKVRLGRSLNGIVKGKLLEGVKDKRFVTYLYGRLIKTWTILCWFCMPSSPQDAGEIVDAAYEWYFAMGEPGYDWQQKTEKTQKVFKLNYRFLIHDMAGILDATYVGIHDTYLRMAADKRGSRIMVALRRYKNANGRWPEGLDDVRALASEEVFIDPVNNSAFVYKLTDDGFTLYSKGKNNIDDGGERYDKAGTDDWLIWPKRKRSCESEEENANDEKE